MLRRWLATLFLRAVTPKSPQNEWKELLQWFHYHSRYFSRCEWKGLPANADNAPWIIAFNNLEVRYLNLINWKKVLHDYMVLPVDKWLQTDAIKLATNLACCPFMKLLEIERRVACKAGSDLMVSASTIRLALNTSCPLQTLHFWDTTNLQLGICSPHVDII